VALLGPPALAQDAAYLPEPAFLLRMERLRELATPQRMSDGGELREVHPGRTYEEGDVATFGADPDGVFWQLAAWRLLGVSGRPLVLAPRM
jgi:hypothetical protein